MARLLDQLAERDARIAELKARLHPIAFERSREAHAEVRQRDSLEFSGPRFARRDW